MTPEQATFLLHEVYLPQIRNELKTTRRVIEAIPVDKGDYKPDPKSMGSMELAKHIASSEVFFMMGAAHGEFKRENAAMADSVKTPADVSAWYEEHANKAAAALAAVSGCQPGEEPEFRDLRPSRHHLHRFDAEPFGASSRAVIRVSASDGGEGAANLRWQRG